MNFPLSSLLPLEEVNVIAKMWLVPGSAGKPPFQLLMSTRSENVSLYSSRFTLNIRTTGLLRIFVGHPCVSCISVKFSSS